MILFELFNSSPKEFQDLSDDESQMKWKDSRKTKLTLRQINRLRKMNDMRTLEHEKEMAFVRKMYSPPADTGDGMGM